MAPPAPDDDGVVQQSPSGVPRKQRFALYTLLSGEHFVNYVTRFAIPYLVPFVCQRFGFSERERARLLNAFQPGYVLTQIPGSWLSELLGPRLVLSLNNAAMATVLLAIPAAGRIAGAWGVWGCIFTLGLVQGPFIIAQAVMNNRVMPPSPSAERPISQMIIRVGNNIAKLVAAALTPWLCGSVAGWRSVPLGFGSVIAGYCVVWYTLTGAVFRRATTSSSSPSEVDKARVLASTKNPLLKKPFTLRLLLCKPVQAALWNQVGHDCMEMQVLGAWAPTYYNQVLGVPLSSVGKYTVFPMAVGFFGKLALGGMESWLLARGASQILIRRLCNSIATVLGCSSLLLFVRASTPALATLCYCGLLAGNSFDYCGFLPNYLELGGDDTAYLSSFMNTSNALICFVISSGLAALKRATGSWALLLAAPVGIRLLAGLAYLRFGSVRSARSHLPPSFHNDAPR